MRRSAAVAFALSCLGHVLAEEPGSSSVADPSAGNLDELVVVGTRTERSWLDAFGTVTLTGTDDLLRLGAHDLAGFARYDPTVSLPFDFGSGDGAFAYGQTGYGGINIRGAEGNRIAIELDDIRQPPQYVSTSFDMGADGGSGGVGRDYFDPAMFEMIEVLKGGASALYGSDAMGGVVSFRTPDPVTFLARGDAGGLIRVQYFSVNESFASQIGGALRQGDTSVMFLYAGRDGAETSNNGDDPPNPAEFTSHAGLLKAEHRLGDHEFHLALEFYERTLFTDVRSAVNSPFSVFTGHVHNDQSLERHRASIRWIFQPDEGRVIDRLDTHLYWQHAGIVSESDSASRPRTVGGIPLPGTERTRWQRIGFETDIAGFSMRGRKDWTAGSWSHRFSGGVEGSAEMAENQFLRVDSGLPQERISFAPTGTRRAGIYLQDEISVGETVFLIPGLRLDWQEISPEPNAAYLERLAQLSAGGNSISVPDRFANLSLSPRLSLGWKPREDLHLYATYARGVRNPTGEELSMIFDHPPDGSNPAGTLTVPNPSLEEEKSDAFEIGVKGEGPAGRYQVAVYHTKYRDFIENGVFTGRDDDEGRDIVTTVNRGEAQVYGFEVSGVLELGHLWTAAEGWQLGIATGKSVGDNLTDNQPLNSVEPWKSVAFVGYEDPDGRYGGRLTGTWTEAVKRVDDTTGQGSFFRPPSWFTLDLGLWWKPSETLSIHAGINNLLDEKYWSWSSVRRGNGHLGGAVTTDRITAPGRNFSISVTKTF